MSPRKNFGQRIHEYLAEPPGEQFVAGKWRFWLVAVVTLSTLNAVLTALIFRDDGPENFISPIMLSVGALVCWLAIGCLHYSDSNDRRLARGVAGLDSLTLLFCIAHFAGLMWAYGHLQTIRSAERKYEAVSAAYNTKAEKLSEDKAKMFQIAERIAVETRKTEKLKNDTAYQLRKAAQSGAKVQTGPSAGVIAPEISTTQIELERPVKPDQTSAQFLGKWDWLIRVMNFGELLLAAITLVFIRNQSAKTNSPAEVSPNTGDFFPTGRYRSPVPAPVGNFTTKKETQRIIDSFDSAKYAAGAQALRDALKDISFRLKGYSFKVTIKPDSVWIMMVEAVQGTQQTVSSCRCDLAILRDAETMPRDKFARKLELTLRRGGFEI
jgi:hypothetical protein